LLQKNDVILLSLRLHSRLLLCSSRHFPSGLLPRDFDIRRPRLLLKLSLKFSRKKGNSRFIRSTSFPYVWTCNPLATYRPLGLTCCCFLHYCKQCFFSKPQNESRNLQGNTSSKIIISCAFAKLGKSDYELRHIYLIVRPSYQHGKTRFPLERLSWKSIFEYFSNICQENSASLKSDKINGYLTCRPIYICYHISHSSS
jgi:hypothetical protein